MKTIDPAVFSRLSGDAGVIAMVGTNPSRIFPSNAERPDDVYPLIVYQTSGLTTPRSHDGPGNIQYVTVKFACMSLDPDEAKSLGGLVMGLLDTQAGTWGGVVVQGSFLEDDGASDEKVRLIQADGLTVYVREVSFNMTFETI